MPHDDQDFSPERVDTQIAQPSTLDSEQGQRLIHDLQQRYSTEQAENEHSLARVWQRLEQNSNAPHTHKQSIVSIEQYRDRHERKSVMQPTPSASRRSRAQRMFSLLGAAAVAALLIGSAAIVLPLVRGTGHQTITGSSHAQTQPAQTWQDTPTSSGIYITSAINEQQDQISKLDSATHKVLWSYPVASSPNYTVKNNTVYVTSSSFSDKSEQYLYAINASTGKLRWHFTIAPDVLNIPSIDPNTNKPTIDFTTGKPMIDSFDLGYLTAPVESDGLIYTLSRSGKVYAIRDTNGKLAWMKKVNTNAIIGVTIYNPSQVTVSNGIVYSAEHNLLFALDAHTGKQLWTTQIDAEQTFNRLQLVGETLYASASHASTHNGTTYTTTSSAFAFSSKDGNKQWQQDFPSWLVSSPTVDNGTVYVSTYDGQLSALKASDGTKLWQHSLGGRADVQPIVQNGIIYAQESGKPSEETSASNNGTTYAVPAVVALNAQGKELWRIQDTNADTSIQTVESGVLYTSKFPNQIVIYAANSGTELWHQSYGNTFTDKEGNQLGITPEVVVIP